MVNSEHSLELEKQCDKLYMNVSSRGINQLKFRMKLYQWFKEINNQAHEADLFRKMEESDWGV